LIRTVKKFSRLQETIGNRYDNAAMESSFGHYKTSTVRDHVFDNEDQVRANVFNYIEVFYNRYRKHTSLG
jgi:putative transposase